MVKDLTSIYMRVTKCLDLKIFIIQLMDSLFKNIQEKFLVKIMLVSPGST